MSGTQQPSANYTQLQTPFQALAQVGGAMNVINQNKLFQGRIAAGQALQQAVDPDTGQVDPLKFNRLLALDPNAAAGMQDAVSQSQNLQGAQQGLQDTRAAAMNTAVSAALALPDAQLHAGTSAGLQRLVTQGVIPPFQAALMSRRLDSITDPQALRSELNQIQLSTLPPDQQTQQIFGSQDVQGNGQTNFSGVRAPARAGGGFAPATGMPVYPSRADLIRLMPTTDSTGRPTATPTGVVVNQAGAGALTGPAGAQLPGQGLPSALVPPGYTGRYSSPGSQNTAPSSPPAPAGSAVVGAAPGVEDANKAAAVAGAQQGIQLQQSADQSPGRQNMLNTMAADMDKYTPGPGSTRETYAQSLIQRYAPDLAKSFGLDPQRVASAESFDKMASQLMMAQTQALGQGTDAKLEAAMHGNPNSGMSKLGAQQMISLMLGNEDAINAKNKAWQTYQQQNGPGSYGAFSTQFNQSFDPRAFQLLRMQPADQARVLSAMTPADQAAFRQKVNAMAASGILSTSGAGQAPPSIQSPAMPSPVALPGGHRGF